MKNKLETDMFIWKLTVLLTTRIKHRKREM